MHSEEQYAADLVVRSDFDTSTFNAIESQEETRKIRFDFARFL